MSSPVAVMGCTIEALPPVTGGVFSIQTSPSQKVKAEGKGVYSGAVDVLVSGTVLGAYTQASPVSITIQPAVLKKFKADGQIALALGDGGTSLSAVSFVNSVSSTTSLVSIKIIDAGQTKILGA